MSKAGQSSGPSSSAAKPSEPSKDWKSKGMYISSILPIKLHIATSPNLLPVVLTFVSQEEAKRSINLDALLDTGCLAGDFVARRVVDKHNIKHVIHSTAKLSVCSVVLRTLPVLQNRAIRCMLLTLPPSRSTVVDTTPLMISRNQ